MFYILNMCNLLAMSMSRVYQSYGRYTTVSL